jgi:hypothetical protein
VLFCIIGRVNKNQFRSFFHVRTINKSRW